MMDYKQKLAAMWQSEAPTVEELLDVVSDFCDDLGSRPELYTDIYDTAGKIFACIGMVTEHRQTKEDVWQPMQPQAIACACRSDCKDSAVLWDDNHLQVINYKLDRYADMILPDNVRLCRKVTL